MEFVPVNDVNNTADTTGYGDVGYAYSIGKYEVSQNQWDAAQAHDPGIGAAGAHSGDQPASTTSRTEAWNNAARFANWLTTGSADSGYYSDGTSYDASPTHGLSHKAYADQYGTTYFVPTENEWYKAAYYDPGAGYYLYPTGSDNVPTAVLSGTDAGTAVYNGDDATPTAPASVFQSGGLSPYGTMGQGGNVWEFNEGAWTPTSGPADRGRRGGFWGEGGSTAKPLMNTATGAMDGTSTDGASAEGNRHGFRISVIPEPASITMLLMGAVAALLWRRRPNG